MSGLAPLALFGLHPLGLDRRLGLDVLLLGRLGVCRCLGPLGPGGLLLFLGLLGLLGLLGALLLLLGALLLLFSALLLLFSALLGFDLFGALGDPLLAGQTADAISLRLLDRGGVALHPDLELVGQLENLLVLDTQLSSQFVDPDLLRHESSIARRGVHRRHQSRA